MSNENDLASGLPGSKGIWVYGIRDGTTLDSFPQLCTPALEVKDLQKDILAVAKLLPGLNPTPLKEIAEVSYRMDPDYKQDSGHNYALFTSADLLFPTPELELTDDLRKKWKEILKTVSKEDSLRVGKTIYHFIVDNESCLWADVDWDEE